MQINEVSKKFKITLTSTEHTTLINKLDVRAFLVKFDINALHWGGDSVEFDLPPVPFGNSIKYDYAPVVDHLKKITEKTY
jgi:hypothetical protein